jgi:formate dehydrogenase
LTDEVEPGVIALAHGWGHKGGWKLANATAGVNVNVLAGAAKEDLEPLAGMAFLNGIPVSVEPVRQHQRGGSLVAEKTPAAPSRD